MTGPDLTRRLCAAFLFAWLTLGLWTACGDEPSNNEAGLSAALALKMLPTEAPWAVPGRGTVSLQHGGITVASVELVRCPDSAARLPRVWGTARAHGSSNPLRVAAPVVLDLLAGTLIQAGTFEPPPGRYCSVTLHTGAADSDALGLQALPTMEDHALDVELAWGDAPQSLRGSQIRSATLTLLDSHGVAAPLELFAALPNLRVNVVLPVLSGLPASAWTDAVSLMDALLTSATATVEHG